MNRRNLLIGLSVLVVAGAGFGFTGGKSLISDFVGNGDARAEVFTGNSDEIAIRGYDPVGYFTQSKPVKGKPEFSTNWKGVNWHFSSAENLGKFVADPEKYAPKYGGYCAYAVANGSTAKTVPEAWTIHDGKLYLNYSLGIKARFDEDKSGYIEKADRNWPEVAK